MKDGPGDNALEVAEPTLHGHYIALGDVTLELLWFEHPGHVGEPVRRPMNQLGLTHVALRVDDLNLVTQRIREFGGTVLEDTRVDFELPHAKGSTVFCTDPDGTRLEINLRTYQEHGTPDPITGLYL
jgi:lactoylglutathione lyase